MKTGIIVQARCGSIRLPSKVLLKLEDKTILEHTISQIKKTKFNKKIIIATTAKKKDKKIIDIAKKNNCDFFCGSEKNVLNRYYEAAKKFKIKNIIRICSDSPFIDPSILEKAFKIFKKKKYDYVSNIIRPTYPAGMSVEIFNFTSLKKCNESITDPEEKEHVTPFIYRNPKIFSLKNFSTKKKFSNYRFSVDYWEDFLACVEIQKIVRQLKISKLSISILVKIIDNNPFIKKINQEKKTVLRY